MGDNNLDKIKQAAEAFYQNIKQVYCPYFKESVSFNAKGIRHIKFKSDREARNRNDQFIRLKNIHLAPEIIKHSHTLQEYRREKRLIPVKTNSRADIILKDVEYFCFISILEDGGLKKKLRIIIKQVEGGEKHFWSIVPAWRNNKELKLYSGNPEED